MDVTAKILLLALTYQLPFSGSMHILYSIKKGGSSLENAIAQRLDNVLAKVNLRFSKAGYSKFEQIYSHA